MGIGWWNKKIGGADADREAPAAAPAADLYGNDFWQRHIADLAPVDVPSGSGVALPSFLTLQPPTLGAAFDPDFGGATASHGATDGTQRFARTQQGGVLAGHTRTADGDHHTRGAGVSADDGVFGLRVFGRRTPVDGGLDEDGETQALQEGSLDVSANGVSGAARLGVGDQTKLDLGFVAGPGGVGGAAGFETREGWGANLALGGGDGRFDVTAGVKGPGDSSISVSGHTVDRDGVGASTNPFRSGPGREVSNTTGDGSAMTVGVDARFVGASVGIGHDQSRRVAFQRAESNIAAEFDPELARDAIAANPWSEQPLFAPRWDTLAGGDRDRYLSARYRGHLDGHTSPADVDPDALQVGDGYTFTSEQSEHVEAGGRVVVVTAGYGDADASQNRTSIARTARGFTVRVESGERDDDLGNVGLGNVVAAFTESSGTSRVAEFEVSDDERGRSELAEFLQTGALPGALDEAAFWEGTPEVQERTEALARRMASPDADPDDIAEDRAALFAATARVNGAVADGDPERLMTRAPAGVAYRRVGKASTRGDHTDLSVAGMSVAHGGESATNADLWWASDDDGVGHERSHQQDTDRWFAPDERTSVTTSREGSTDTSPAVVFRSLQPTNSAQRHLLDDVGADGMDPAMRAAWADGKVGDARRDRVELAMTSSQLDHVRDRMALDEEDLAGVRGDAARGRRWWLLRQPKVDVGSAEDFDALSLDAKKQFLDDAAHGAQYADEWKAGSPRSEAQPWRTLPLALRSTDPDERDELLRSLFASVEASSVDGTTAVLQLVYYLEKDGELAGLSSGERADLLKNLRVGVDDSRVNDRADKLRAAPRDEAALDLAAGLLADRHRELEKGDRRYRREGVRAHLGMEVPQRPEDIDAHRADSQVDWLIAAESVDPELVAEGVRTASRLDANAVGTILHAARHEPWRQDAALRTLQRAGVLPDHILFLDPAGE